MRVPGRRPDGQGAAGAVEAAHVDGSYGDASVTTLERDRTDGVTRPTGARRLVVPGLVGAVLVLAVLVRLRTASPLWLDEALSVHIARLPLRGLHAALRQDGAPPVYYLLLHGWMRVFGQSVTAVRALSTVFALAALPVAWALGRRWRGPSGGWTMLLLLASSPFAAVYATETRMYALVTLEVLLGGLLLLRAWDRPSAPRLILLAVLTAVLVLTHYWSLFLLACLGLGLLRRARAPGSARRLVLALVAGGGLALPWVPTLLFQVTHTGTPWAPAPSLVAALDTVGAWAGGGTLAARVLALLLMGLMVVAAVGRRHPSGLLLRLPADPAARLLLGLWAGPLLLGLVVGIAAGSGYATRYSAIALPGALLLIAAGLHVLPRRSRLAWTAVVVVLGLVGALRVPFDDRKTQAGVIAAALRAGLVQGDLVVACPDQVGVAVQDLLPAGVDQVVYPTLQRPDRIDWVDYARRNHAADPRAFLARVLARAAGRPVWLITQGDYRTFGNDCQRLGAGLAAGHAVVSHPVKASKHFTERADLFRYADPR